jgi:pyruvate dehydrogenase E2 component (dihydrolipoamide acetyltransferase)
MNDAAGLTEVRVPDLGNFKDVAVIDVLVKPGDRIAVDAPLITLETDKATMDVPSTAAGVVDRIHTSKGGTVNSGDLVITLKADGAQPTAAAEPGSAAAAPGAQRPPAAPAAAPAPEASGGARCCHCHGPLILA